MAMRTARRELNEDQDYRYSSDCIGICGNSGRESIRWK